MCVRSNDPMSGSTDVRQEPRVNLFVMATLCENSRSAPVKIRNISVSGALIEGEVPIPSTRICLRRGSLAALGEVIWRSGGRSGLKFDETVAVTDWLPRGRGPASQQHVDEMVQQIKAGTAAVGATNESAPHRLSASEFRRVQKLLETLADDLSDDSEMLAKYGSQLQCLDLASQILGKLSGHP